MEDPEHDLKKNKAFNHLIKEKSPYLMQHAYNPVDWHPWGDTAINKAKSGNKPIILSIGYSTCHWCHVMEKESFEDDQIARIMNRHFISIKVDREERPDIDTIYMSAVNLLTGSGGWPLNIFLTPELKPFFGGTYFPVKSNFQMISWEDILLRIARMWQEKEGRRKIQEIGDNLKEDLNNYLSKPQKKIHDTGPLSLQPLESAFSQYLSSFDEKNGGFGKAPKFPSPAIQNFLFSYGEEQKNQNHKKAIAMAKQTLEAIAQGGIYDRLGGGVHRYSTDDKWHVPHFEKMLYDNSQLIINFLEAYPLTGNRDFKDIAAETADYVIRDMTHDKGGFYSAEDADSIPPGSKNQNFNNPEKVEGAFYVWEKQEIDEILGDNVKQKDIFLSYFNVFEDGNVEHDPHGFFQNKNILTISKNKNLIRKQTGLPEAEFDGMIRDAKHKLLQARNMRNRPHLDDKIITSWNGLMISALSKTFKILNDEKYLSAARNAAFFIRENLYDTKNRQLFRRWREGERKIPGLSEDYAYFIQGLLDLYESDSNRNWLDWAVELIQIQIDEFYDQDQGGFFMTSQSHDQNLIIRVKEENDNVVPSANAVSAGNLIRVSRNFEKSGFYKMAEDTVKCFYNKIQQFPSSMPQMLVVLKRLVTDNQ